MTDNEIIKALECCSANDIWCGDCPYENLCTNTDITKLALDLINRQKAEIENMNNLVVYNATCATKLQLKLVEAKAEAVKEFDELLKEDCLAYPLEKDDLTMLVDVKSYNNLLKEMVGEG